MNCFVFQLDGVVQPFTVAVVMPTEELARQFLTEMLTNPKKRFWAPGVEVLPKLENVGLTLVHQEAV